MEIVSLEKKQHFHTMAMKNYPAPKPTPSHDRLSITTATGAGSSCITHVCKKWISFADSLPYA